MSRDQRIDQSAMSYCVCKFKTTVRGATYLMTSHVSSSLWILPGQFSVLQSLVIVPEPEQIPPLASFIVLERNRDCIPPPQVFEHEE